jgi:hypothetical protein
VNLKTFLVGSWKVQRLILDRACGLNGRLDGHATFAPCWVDGLSYKERGRLVFDKHEGWAEQSYLYDFSQSEGRASVRFSDRRLFHDLDLSAGLQRVQHSCDPDRYDGLFVAVGPTEWWSMWKVAGPRKDYELTTIYTRG